MTTTHSQQKKKTARPQPLLQNLIVAHSSCDHYRSSQFQNIHCKDDNDQVVNCFIIKLRLFKKSKLIINDQTLKIMNELFFPVDYKYKYSNVSHFINRKSNIVTRDPYLYCPQRTELKSYSNVTNKVVFQETN